MSSEDKESARHEAAEVASVPWDSAQLETLLAIVEEGTFEAAARRLHISPSAVSQRIRALETVVGQVLVRRTTPSTATPAGEPLARLARQLRLLGQEAAAQLLRTSATTSPGGVPIVDLSVALDPYSLNTWFRDVLTAASGWPATAVRLWLAEGEHTKQLLRSGAVLAAVTSDPHPVQGCAVERLGVIRYVAVAAPSLMDQTAAAGLDPSNMPMVTLSDRDDLPNGVLTRHDRGRPEVVHHIPSSAEFTEAIRRGLGWGMVPDVVVADTRNRGRLVPLPTPGGRTAEPMTADLELWWQRWRVRSTALDTLTRAVRDAFPTRPPPRADGQQ